MAHVLDSPELHAVVTSPVRNFCIRIRLGGVWFARSVTVGEVRASGRCREHFTSSAFDVDAGCAALIGSFVIQGAVNHQQGRRLVSAHRVCRSKVISRSQGGREDGGAGEQTGGIEEQAKYHLPTVGVSTGEDSANIIFFAQFINDCLGKTNIIGAELSRFLRQVLTGIIKVVLNTAWISHDGVAAGQSIKSKISKSSDYIW